MDFNLPLLLFLAVAFTGAVWLVDLALLQRKRKVAVAALDAQFSALPESQRYDNPKYQSAVEEVGREPLVVEYSKSFFPVLLFVFVLRSFVVEPFQIPSESMVPTLEVGDFILVNKFSYGIRLPLVRTKVIDIDEPKRGDVMVFFPPHRDEYYIKRVIGLPGDVVRIENNQVSVNGKPLAQTFAYADERNDRSCAMAGGSGYNVAKEKVGDREHLVRNCERATALSAKTIVKTVPEGHYFMLGDNRDNSLDSRRWGTVPEERIVGKAFAIWMTWESLTSLPSFSRVGKID